MMAGGTVFGRRYSAIFRPRGLLYLRRLQWLLDLIVSGTQRGTQDRVYVGVEVSITADANDVDRAADRPEILRKLTGGPALAVVVASRMDEPQRKLAIRRGVETVLHPE